ncbi:MAG: 4-hydroxythreonine-4-phosphate dehydrogenase PdxA, partial [Phycisphaerae bacterium]
MTLGDIAGIGPEVVVRALAAGEVSQCCLPIVVGHPEIVRRAVELTGCGLNVRVIHERPNDAAALRSRIEEQSGMSCVQREVSSQDLVSAGTIFCWNPTDDTVLDVAAGRVHPAAGDAAWRCLVAAASLARERIVDAIVTAPLNKESLHLAGHHFPGHTEILADQCGVPEYAMMLHLAESRIASLRSLVQTATERREAPAVESGRHGLSIAHVTLHTSIRSVPEL